MRWFTEATGWRKSLLIVASMAFGVVVAKMLRGEL